MTTHEESADPRVKVSLIKEAIAEIEAVVQKSLPAPKWRRSNAIYCFRLLKCGRWLPLNRAINRWATAGSASPMRGPQPRRQADTRLKTTRTGRCFFL
jgi:hypothetical protein